LGIIKGWKTDEPNQPVSLNITVFKEACTVMNDTLAWDIGGNRDNTKCLDIDPDTLYDLPMEAEKIA
jgi:hypothetical protein